MAGDGGVWYNLGQRMAHQLHVLSGKKQGFVLDVGDGDVVDVGNRKTAKLSIRDPWISWNHAKITAEAGGKFFVEDVGSSNGTWVNGEKVKRRELKANDVIHFGKTKVKFAGLAKGGDAPAAEVKDVVGEAKKPAGDAPWWDKVIESGAAPAAGAGGGAAEVQLLEERRMRQALEKFLDLPRGASVGDVARAGALEARVRELEAQLEAARKGAAEAAEAARAAPAAPSGDAEALERAERARQELTKKVVELESNASAAETRTVDLERRLKELTESNKKEVARTRERHEAELAALKADLEQERSTSKAQGGDAALQAVRSQSEALAAEVASLREKLRAAEQKVDDQAREFESSRALDGGSVEALRSALEASKAEALHWREEHAKVVQEIDEISMEQIEIEDGLKARIAELEAGGDQAAPG